MNTPLNQILYGPPGTGKTYSTVGKTLKILDATDEQKQTIKSIGRLKEEFGTQVEFVTFHQSFSYEDFVEGLKANSDDNDSLSYFIENGVFKTICENAKKNLENSQSDRENKLDVELLLNDFANYVVGKIIEGEKFLLTKKKSEIYLNEISSKPDDSFKSFITAGSLKGQRLTRNIIIRDYQKFFDGDIKGPENIKPAQKSKSSHHGNALYYYELFLCIQKFQNKQLKEDINYLIDSTKKPYILIIDEINRGNISRIFGELITLIEPSKRAGGDEEISVKLPYSKEDFSVPNNLYIIGTMNTADRSLTMMDTALRRRFDFVEMMPNIDLVNCNFDGIDVRKILEVINQRIEVLYDREHTIGHSFLMKVENLDELRNAFKNKILPLLEEYFYDNWEKIRLVLNDDKNNFYEKIDGKIFGNEFDRVIYQRQDLAEMSAEDFINIYQSDE
jgi:5-methylcytosine-specific restriction protein B